jgi:membrane protein DedA with SNARE-associated domain
MITKLLTIIFSFVISIISMLGYGGVVLLMAIESAAIPLPSEMIMPFAGYLVDEGRFNIWLLALAGAIGNLFGSLITYYIGKYGGRPLVWRYGRYVLISHKDLERAEKWVDKYGSIGIFFSRLLPVIRTYISLPAGVVRMNLVKFISYSFIGAYIWSLFLAYIGLAWGEHWEKIRVYFEKFDILVGLLAVIVIVWYIRRHLNNSKKDK